MKLTIIGKPNGQVSEYSDLSHLEFTMKNKDTLIVYYDSKWNTNQSMTIGKENIAEIKVEL